MAAEAGSAAGARRPRLVHVVAGLGLGGAESTLLRLLAWPASRGFDHHVLSLTAGGALAAEVAALAPVSELGMARGRLPLVAALRLRREVAKLRPDLLVGWMYHGNLAASFASRSRVPVVWNVRHTPDELGAERRLTRILIRLGARFSTRPRAIVYNSLVSARFHAALGYAAGRAMVVPNGVDLGSFRPRPEAGAALRSRLGLGGEALLVGRVGRFHPMKDYSCLLAAAALLAGRLPDLHWVLVGPGVEAENPTLMGEVRRLGLGSRVHLLGPLREVPELLAGLDLFCSSSRFGEGFPNVVAEAMASAVPAVATDVGDSALVVGDEDQVVPPGDPAALAAAIARLAALPVAARRQLGHAARERIRSRFDAAELLPRHGELWRAVLAGVEVA